MYIQYVQYVIGNMTNSSCSKMITYVYHIIYIRDDSLAGYHLSACLAGCQSMTDMSIHPLIKPIDGSVTLVVQDGASTRYIVLYST